MLRALEAADDLAFRESFGAALGGIGAGARAETQPGDGGEVEGTVGVAVAAAIEPVALRLAARGGQWGGAAEHGEAGL